MESTQDQSQQNQASRTWGEFFTWVWDQIVRLANAGYQWCAESFGYYLRWKRQNYIQNLKEEKERTIAANPNQAEAMDKFYEDKIKSVENDFAQRDAEIKADF